MSLNVTFNGVVYVVPETGETGWGGNTTSYLVAIAAGALQKTGGSFTLSAQTDFGASFGLKALSYISRNANPALSGIFRLGNTEGVKWRNAADSGDLDLSVSAADQLTFNGVPLEGNTFTANRALISNGSGIISAATTTDTEIGFVNGVTSAIQTQLNSKLNLAGGMLTGLLTLQDQMTFGTDAITTFVGTPTTGGTLALDTYYYKVYALNANSLIGVPSEEIIVVVGGSDDQVDLSWDAVSGATSYRIQRGTVQGSGDGYFTTSSTTLSDSGQAFDAGGGAVTPGNQFKVILPGTLDLVASQGSVRWHDYTNNVISGSISCTSAGELELISTLGSAAGNFIFNKFGAPIAERIAFATGVAIPNILFGSGGPGSIEGNPIIFSLGGSEKARFTTTGLNILPTTNQLVLGTTNTITLNAAAPAASRIYTMPDVLSNADFIMSAGTQSIGGAKTFTDVNVIQSVDSAGVSVVLQSVNTDNTNVASHARHNVSSGGASGGDAFTNYENQINDWSLGLDNSDNDKFKLSQNDLLGVNDYMVFDLAGNVGFGPNADIAGMFSIKTTAAEDLRMVLFVDNSTGDPYTNYSTDSTNWSAGIDNSNSDIYGIYLSNVIGTNLAFALSSNLQIIGADGALSTPYYSYILDQDTGERRIGDDHIALVTGGVDALDINSSQVVDALVQLKGKGTATNDDAASGYIGEHIFSVVAEGSAVTVTTTGQYVNITSISLPAGDWDVTGQIGFTLNGVITGGIGGAVSAFSANTTTDHVSGDNVLATVRPTASENTSVTVSAFRISLGSTTTYYLKGVMGFSSGAPKVFGRISARRVR